MTYPRHWLLQWTGHQGEITETFSNGIRLALYGVQDAPVDEEEYLDETAVPALSAWFASPSSFISSSAKMLNIKFNEIGPNGRYVEQTVTHERTVNVSGGTSGVSNIHPLQVAWCLSWRTNAAARGPGSHGRIYVPRPVVALSALGDASPANCASAGIVAEILLDSLDVSVGVPPGAVLRPSIVSNVGAGLANQIDYIVIDSQLDIQRRRAFTQTREETIQAVTYS